jgi:protein required for attachment to host cells
MATTTTWIVAADASRARILQRTGRSQPLVEVQTLSHPTGRMHERDLQTDGEPRFNGHGGVGKPGSAPTGGPASDREAQGAREHAVGVFARQVGQYLEKARLEHRYDRLVVVAPPKFLGALRGEFGKELAQVVVDEIPKDLSGLNARQLDEHFKSSSAT